jgi:GNAT superfamily N-acetyltransferase
MLSCMQTIVRQATLQDAALVAEMNLRLADETEGLRLEPLTVRAGVEALLSNPALGQYFIAEHAGRVAGQTMITYEWSDWRNANIWWLQSVYVMVEFRRQGVFRRLFEHLQKMARADGRVCGLRLYMHAANERARETYRRLGMSETHYQVLELPLDET